MTFNRHVTISTKLNILLLLPLITLVFFAYNTVFEKYQQLHNSQNALHYIQLTQQFADIVHQLQAERGLSAGKVGSKGKIYQQSLAKQRQQTDEKIKQLNQFFSDLPNYLTAENRDKFNLLKIELAKLVMIRSEIDQGKDDFFEFYSHLITEILNSISLLQMFSVSAEFYSLSSSYINILWLGEFAGQERGALNGVFTSQKFNATQFSSISSYIAGQKAALRSFNNNALSKHKQQIGKMSSHPTTAFVLHSREILFNKGLRNDALNGIQSLIGYGGLIHDFKNHVIRGEDIYAVSFQQKFNAALHEIEYYQSLPNINVKEKDALDAIKNTFQKYKSHLATVTAMKSGQINISQIDQNVIVDDQPALKAIKFLRHSLSSQSPKYWWQHATARINLIYDISTSIAEDLMISGQQTRYQMQRLLLLYSTLTLAIILAACFIGFRLRSRLVNEINYIANTMRMSQKKRNFNQLLTISGNDEISNMAVAFNNLITERKAAEEKLLLELFF